MILKYDINPVSCLPSRILKRLLGRWRHSGDGCVGTWHTFIIMTIIWLCTVKIYFHAYLAVLYIYNVTLNYSRRVLLTLLKYFKSCYVHRKSVSICNYVSVFYILPFINSGHYCTNAWFHYIIMSLFRISANAVLQINNSPVYSKKMITVVYFTAIIVRSPALLYFFYKLKKIYIYVPICWASIDYLKEVCVMFSLFMDVLQMDYHSFPNEC